MVLKEFRAHQLTPENIPTRLALRVPAPCKKRKERGTLYNRVGVVKRHVECLRWHNRRGGAESRGFDFTY